MSAEWVRRDFRGRHTAWPAATRLASLPDIFLGMGGLRQMPLNLTRKRNPPIHVPAPKPPGRYFDSASVFWYFRTSDLSDRYDTSRERSQFGVGMSNKSSITF